MKQLFFENSPFCCLLVYIFWKSARYLLSANQDGQHCVKHLCQIYKRICKQRHNQEISQRNEPTLFGMISLWLPPTKLGDTCRETVMYLSVTMHFSATSPMTKRSSSRLKYFLDISSKTTGENTFIGLLIS